MLFLTDPSARIRHRRFSALMPTTLPGDKRFDDTAVGEALGAANTAIQEALGMQPGQKSHTGATWGGKHVDKFGNVTQVDEAGNQVADARRAATPSPAGGFKEPPRQSTTTGVPPGTTKPQGNAFTKALGGLANVATIGSLLRSASGKRIGEGTMFDPGPGVNDPLNEDQAGEGQSTLLGPKKPVRKKKTTTTTASTALGGAAPKVNTSPMNTIGLG